MVDSGYPSEGERLLDDFNEGDDSLFSHPEFGPLFRVIVDIDPRDIGGFAHLQNKLRDRLVAETDEEANSDAEKAERNIISRMAFGELLGQKKWWKSRNGIMRRKEMSIPHKANLLAWIERSAEDLEFADAQRFLDINGTLGYVPDDVIDGISQRDAHEWVRSSTFYRALLKDLQKASDEASDSI